MRWFFAVVAAVAVTGVVGGAFAKELPKKEDVVTLNELVVTASRQQEAISSVPADVSVITQADIAESTARDVADLLRQEAGVYVTDITGVRRNYTVDLLGFGETGALNTLVLVDGRRANLEDLSGTDWTQIPLDRVARIEIVRGSRASTLYGDNAAGGVINIITKKGTTNEVDASLQGGSYGTYKASAHAGGSVDAFSYSFSGSYLKTDGYRDNSGDKATDFGTNLGYRFSDLFSLALSSGYHKDTAGLPGAITASEFAAGVSRTDTLHPNDHADYDDYYVQATPEFSFLTNSTAKIDLSYRKRNTQSDYSYTGGNYAADTNISTTDISPQVNIRENLFGFDHRLNLGMDYSDAKENTSYISEYFGSVSKERFDLEKEDYGYYLNDDLAVTPAFSVSAGYRYDTVTYTLQHFSYIDNLPKPIDYDESLFTVGVNYKLNAKSNVYLAYSKGFRYPVLDEFFSYISNSFNLALKPQTSSEYQAGVRYAIDDSTSLSLSLFRLRTKDEIFYDPYYYWDSTYLYYIGSNINMDGDTTRQGIELTAKRSFGWGQLGLDYTYSDTNIDGGTYDGKEIPGVPKHEAGFNLLVDYWKPVTVAVNGHYVGKRYFISDWTNSFSQQDAYFVTNAKVSYAWKKVTAFLDINNLFDKKYSEYGVISANSPDRSYYPSPGRNFMAGVSVKF